MLNSWLSSKSSRHRKTPSNSVVASDHAQSGPSDASSFSQSTVGPVHTPGNLSSDVPLSEIHAHINDPSVYAQTPSLIHSTEKEAKTLRMSDAPPSLDVATQRAAPEGALFTPQDAIVAQVFGKSVLPATDPAKATSPPPLSLPQPSVSLTTRTSDLVPTPPPPSVPEPLRTRTGPLLTIYEPFSGAKLSEHTPVSPSAATPGDGSISVSLPTADDRKLWSSLERILELQAEIAAMHADMEGVGKSSGPNTHAGGIASVGAGEDGNVGSRRRSRRGQTLPVGDEEEHEPDGGTAGGHVSEISTEHSDGEDEDEDEEDEEGIHGYGKRRRDEEFARLGEQFAQRKAAIGGIMNKLDALSTALKTFHTLPSPLFDLAAASHTDTISSAPSDVFAPSPLHTRPSDPPPSTPPTLPVPPVSTLAPPTSLGDPSAPSGPALIPVLPQIALPTIIPGAPHVESPADMEHTQSIFRGLP